MSLLGRIHGKHPGLKALTVWARDALHSSLSLLSLKTNTLFEVTFSHPEGRIHALTQADLVCETVAISFSSWRPHFDSKAPEAEESLDYPVWVQIVDLCQVLREEWFLKLIGEQMGQVISIDNSEAYRAKLFGPRIRLLVRDLQQLPQTVVIPRLDGEGTVEYTLEFSGMPKQCGRCRAHDHLVRNCPKKHTPSRKKEESIRNQGVDFNNDSIKVPEVEMPPDKEDKEVAAPKSKVQFQERTPQQDVQREDMAKHNENKSQQKSQVSKDKVQVQERSPQQDIQREDMAKNSEKKNQQEKLKVQVQERMTDMQKEDMAKHTENKSLGGEATQQSSSMLGSSTCGVQKNLSNGQIKNQTNLLQPDEINFPKLQTPIPTKRGNSPTSERKEEPKFVWRSPHIAKPTPKAHATEGSRGKEKGLDSAPLTRQGYRTGRLAEDFWSAIGMPNTPATKSKMLRVIPFLTKNHHTEQTEYLVDIRRQSFSAIAYVHIAESLAGIPWTQIRARQHVVNEVSQVLHKILIFNNNLSNPFQNWTQGRWFVQWGQGVEGEYICTLYVSIDAPEHKIKPRKGLHMGWRREPVEISQILNTPVTDEIQVFESDHTHWQKMAGRLPQSKANEQFAPESHNRFATLLDDEDVPAQ